MCDTQKISSVSRIGAGDLDRAARGPVFVLSFLEAGRCLRKSNYRRLQRGHFTRTLRVVNGSYHFRRGMAAVTVFAGLESSAQPPAVMNLPPPVHNISPAIREAVVEKLPKYTAPPPKAPELAAVEDPKDSRDILHLPTV